MSTAFGVLARSPHPHERALAQLTGPVRRVSKRKTIRREGDPVDGFYLLQEGWVASSINSPDGARFITKIHLPGDLIGSPSMVTDVAAETLFTLTDAVIAPISLSRFGTMVNEHPRLGTIFLLNVQFERIELTNRLFTVGRANAHAAVAALVLDLANRLSEGGEMQDETSFVMHLTQEEIGDATGLTSVHVNRTINRLRRDSILEQIGKVVRLTDRGHLETLAGRKPTARARNMQWLTPSRH